jgi:hypothetical protein
MIGFTPTTDAKRLEAGGERLEKTDRVAWDPETQGPARKTIVVDTPPRNTTTIENRYVEVETDRYQRAHAWAAEQVARKQPGASATIHQLESLIRQKLASEAV